jgi:hypothetical protein
MLTLKDIVCEMNPETEDVPNPVCPKHLSFQRGFEKSLLFIEWPVDARGRQVKVRISIMELSDLNGQGVCDSEAIMAALRRHRDHIERRANALYVVGADEVVLDIGSLTAVDPQSSPA